MKYALLNVLVFY